jgi:hypothetical protein
MAISNLFENIIYRKLTLSGEFNKTWEFNNYHRNVDVRAYERTF